MSRQVTFAAPDDSAIISIPKSNRSKQNWHSLHDRRRFLQATLGEARRLRGMLARGRDNGEDLTYEDLCECIGIEKYLSPEVLRIANVRKRAHIDAIVVAQTNRDPDSTHTEVLAQVSKSSSFWARARANELALKYSCSLLEENDTEAS